MTYPPQLPTVLFSALNSVERSPGRRRRPASRTQSPHTGHRPTNPQTTKVRRACHRPQGRIRINLAGVIALAVVIVTVGVALGLMLGDAEKGTSGSLGLQPGPAAGLGILNPVTKTRDQDAVRHLVMPLRSRLQEREGVFSHLRRTDVSVACVGWTLPLSRRDDAGRSSRCCR
jgi:hypothetical protein